MSTARSVILGSHEHPGLTKFRKFNQKINDHVSIRVAGANYHDVCVVTYRDTSPLQLHEELVYSQALSSPERLEELAVLVRNFQFDHVDCSALRQRPPSNSYSDHCPVGAVIKGWRDATDEEVLLLNSCIQAGKDKRTADKAAQKKREAERKEQQRKNEVARLRNMDEDLLIAEALSALKKRGAKITISGKEK
jgi:hypothetical protein